MRHLPPIVNRKLQRDGDPTSEEDGFCMVWQEVVSRLARAVVL